MTLKDLAIGGEGVIDKVTSDAPWAQRIMAPGFMPGTKVKAVRRAPLGDPTEFEVRGGRVCLRQAQAAIVALKPQ